MPRSITELIGQTLQDIYQVQNDEGLTAELVFRTVGGDVYSMRHEQECCEDVWLEDINGDLSDLLDSPILGAEVGTNSDESETREKPVSAERRVCAVGAYLDPDEPYEGPESYTWTFYRIWTVKGHVVLRWYGESNGQYSERVTIRKNGETWEDEYQ